VCVCVCGRDRKRERESVFVCVRGFVRACNVYVFICLSTYWQATVVVMKFVGCVCAGVCVCVCVCLCVYVCVCV